MRVGLLAMSAIAIAGCTQVTTYGYRYKMQQDFGGEEPEPAPAEARQLLANARTVAFFPPDTCINVDAAQSPTKARLLRANCGVLMSSLERAAESAGYEVLSWQNLRGGKRPIDFAREANVDVLFEVNEFDLGKIMSSEVHQTLSFFEQREAGEAPLTVSSSVAQACAGYANRSNPSKERGDYGTIDIKTVSVADGHARWRFRKTLSLPNGVTDPPALFQGQNRPKPGELLLGILGGIALAGGATLITFEQVSTDDPLTSTTNEKFSTGGASYALTVAGVAAIVGAVVYHSTAGTVKPDPAAVLCTDATAVAVFAPPTVAPAETYSTEHTFNETHGDESSGELDKLRATMIGQFVQVLKEVHPTRAPLPLPAPPPAPMAPDPANPTPVP